MRRRPQAVGNQKNIRLISGSNLWFILAREVDQLSLDVVAPKKASRLRPHAWKQPRCYFDTFMKNFLPFALPDIGEEEIAEGVDSLRSGWLTTGP